MKRTSVLSVVMAVLGLMTIPGIQDAVGAQSASFRVDGRSQGKDERNRDRDKRDRDRGNRNERDSDDDDRDSDDDDRDSDDERDSDDDRDSDRRGRNRRGGISDGRNGCVDANRDGRCDSRISLPDMVSAILIDRGQRTTSSRWLPSTVRDVRFFDADRNGKPERAIFLDKANRIVQVWLDTNRDGRADRVQNYRNGRLYNVIK